MHTKITEGVFMRGTQVTLFRLIVNMQSQVRNVLQRKKKISISRCSNSDILAVIDSAHGARRN